MKEKSEYEHPPKVILFTISLIVILLIIDKISHILGDMDTLIAMLLSLYVIYSLTINCFNSLIERIDSSALSRLTFLILFVTFISIVAWVLIAPSAVEHVFKLSLSEYYFAKIIVLPIVATSCTLIFITGFRNTLPYIYKISKWVVKG